ncbi:ribonuclease H-like domain-containing protein [Dissophora ornata]|nr:ribonuclease H-like domain-containing protein [Dissophora ornata]
MLKVRLRKHLKKNPENNSILKALLGGSGGDEDEEVGADVAGHGHTVGSSVVVEEEVAAGHRRKKKNQREEQIPKQEQSPTQGQSHKHEDAAEKEDEDANEKKLHRNCRYDYYLCFDVEATCERGYSFEFPNEVIEFPVVLLDGSTLEVVDEFHSYVRPTYRPTLSDFCVELTGISQETIDAAPTFTEVLALFQDWLTKHGIILEEGSAYGPFDIRDFISKQCIHSNIPRPSYFVQSYIDVRTMFRDFFDLIQWQNLGGMLSFMSETFEGRQHSGICDARMVALIAKRLAEGFSLDNEDDKDANYGLSVFTEANKNLVAPKWSTSKIRNLGEGCVLKANRGTDQTFVKMMSFKRLEKLEALATAAEETSCAPSASSASAPKGKSEEKKDKQVSSLLTVDAPSALLSPPESPPHSPILPKSTTLVESFVTDSKYAALMSEPEF